MSNRDLTELFVMLRNAVLYTKNVYSDEMNTDNVALLDRRSSMSVKAIDQPNWIYKYEEIRNLLSKIKSCINDLLRIHDTTARLVLNDNTENELQVKII
ncbi:uncharacterized protein LOC131440697 isoform X3 [Malaya genurostris]|uniref:uncharacterized protein LOC131440697 isoform X3 n=1 Tax=Malaya genurostris TaxID=325434 RepID=UPI0026F3F0F5|nr:uncharacterized protein LOC131440697 isoform X3 [Malaya genurostris]